jgi:hypothetical protein
MSSKEWETEDKNVESYCTITREQLQEAMENLLSR